MKVFDQHVHSEISIDSTQKMEDYVKKCQDLGVEYFVTTEHLDLDDIQHKMDIIPDFELQNQMISELNEKYDVKVLTGIEVGYKPSIAKRNAEILSKREFDVVLLSIHESEEHTVIDPEYLDGNDLVYGYNKYLELAYDAVDNFENFDIITHLDYFLRYIDKIDISKCKTNLEKVLSRLIENGKTLEFNTRFFYRYNDLSYNKFIFTLYYNLGGRNVSLGSDAHVLKAYYGGFNESIELLKEIGFTEITHFIKRHPVKVSI